MPRLPSAFTDKSGFRGVGTVPAIPPLMNDPKDPSYTDTERPDENNRPILDDDILKDEEPIREPRSEEQEGSSGEENEDDQIPPPDPPLGGLAFAY